MGVYCSPVFQFFIICFLSIRDKLLSFTSFLVFPIISMHMFFLCARPVKNYCYFLKSLLSMITSVEVRFFFFFFHLCIWFLGLLSCHKQFVSLLGKHLVYTTVAML